MLPICPLHLSMPCRAQKDQTLVTFLSINVPMEMGLWKAYEKPKEISQWRFGGRIINEERSRDKDTVIGEKLYLHFSPRPGSAGSGRAYGCVTGLLKGGSKDERKGGISDWKSGAGSYVTKSVLWSTRKNDFLGTKCSVFLQLKIRWFGFWTRKTSCYQEGISAVNPAWRSWPVSSGLQVGLSCSGWSLILEKCQELPIGLLAFLGWRHSHTAWSLPWCVTSQWQFDLVFGWLQSCQNWCCPESLLEA